MGKPARRRSAGSGQGDMSGLSDHPDGRMPSGIAGLDQVLLGGFVRNGIYIVQGPPGSGKTILANQICYTQVAAGGRALYVTLLSEQHERMLSNLRQMRFFDPGCIAREMSYISAFQTLEREGLAGLLALLRRELVGHRATVLVIDGLVAAEAYATNALALKKFVHELQMLCSAGDCTMFLLTSAVDATVSAEHTMVDGMIEIGTQSFGWRVERQLLVRKFRGSDYLAGQHAMAISTDGITIWPRIEALLTAPGRAARRGDAARAGTGIAGLDAMVGGGIPKGSATLLLGPTGTGKTAIGLRFLAGCSADEPGLWLGFYESPEQLEARAADMAPALVPLIRDGVVRFVWQSPSEGLIDRVTGEVIDDVRQRRVKRLVVDGLLGFRDMTVQPERLGGFYRAFANEMRGLDVTAFYTVEVPELLGPVLRAPVPRLTAISENLLLLRFVEHDGRLKRLISVMKVRNSAFDPRLRELEIGGGGVAIGEAFDGERALLSGYPTPESEASSPRAGTAAGRDPGGV